MDVDCFYGSALGESENKSKIYENKYILTGLATNIDYVTHLENEYIKNKCVYTNFNEEAMIEDQKDFYSALYSYISTGRGGELFVKNDEICEWMKNEFSWKFKIGGTGAQICNALSMLNNKVILHSTSMSEKLRELLCGEQIYLPSGNKVLKLDECNYENTPYEHFIYEFDESLTIGHKDKEIKCPRANRLMLHLDENLEFNKDFLQFALENAKCIRAIVLSGFNIITNKEDLQQKLDYVSKCIKQIKALNNDIFVYFENGDTKNKELKKLIFFSVLDFADCIGMNENEFEDLLVNRNMQVDVKDINDLLDKALYIYNELKFKELIIHAENFSVGITGDDPIKVRDSLFMGNLVSCNRARTGWFGGYDELRDCIKEIPVSTEGIEQIEELIKKGVVDENLICKINESQGISVAPSRKVRKPVCTVGLGDSFVAGFISLK